MKRIFVLLACFALILFCSPAVFASGVDDYYGDFNESMDEIEQVEFPSIEEIKAYFDDLFNIEALQQAGDALRSLFTSPYVERAFSTAALLGLISLVLFGHK